MIKKLCVLSLLTFSATTFSVQADDEFAGDLITKINHRGCNHHKPQEKCCKRHLKSPLFGQFGITGGGFTAIAPGAIVPFNAAVQTEGFTLNADGSITLADAKNDQTYSFRIDLVAVGTDAPRLNINIPGLHLELEPVILPVPTPTPNQSLFYYTASFVTTLSPDSVVSLSNSTLGGAITLFGGTFSSSATLQVTQISKSLD